MTIVKVGYLIDTLSCDTAGTQKQLLEIIRRLDRHNFEPYLICLYNSEWMSKNPLPCPLVVLDYHGFLKMDFPKVVGRLRRFTREQGIDIIQTFFEDSIFVALLGKIFSGKPPVLISSRRDMGLGKENQPWYHSLYSFVLPWVNHYFDGILANSRQVRDYVSKREKTPLKKIHVIYNGISVSERPTKPPSIFKELEKKVVLGVVASLTRVKRHDILIKATVKLREEYSLDNFCILIIGDGPERGNLQELVEKLDLQNFIYFTGLVRNVEDYVWNLDAGVLCSDREGLSNAILEYMACGLPVVATSVGGNVELVNEANGICVPPGDCKALAEAMFRLIGDADLRTRLGKNSLFKIQASFSWGKSMRELESYYSSLLVGKMGNG